MLHRLESLVILGANIPLLAIRRQIASAIDIVVHLGRLRDKSRRVLEITEVMDFKDNEIILNPLYKFTEEGGDNKKIIGKLEKVNDLIYTEKLNRAGIRL